LTVEQAMVAPFEVARGDELVADRLQAAAPTHPGGLRDAWPVMDGGRFVGMVARQQLLDAVRAGRAGTALRELVPHDADAATAETFPHVHADQSIDVALQRMGQANLDALPVVSRRDVHELLGVVALTRLPLACEHAVEEESAVEARHGEPTPAKALLTAAVGGVIGLFLVGLLLAHHYNSARQEQAAEYHRTGTALARQGRVAEAIEQFRAALSLNHSDENRLALGLALTRADRGPEAKVYLDEVLRADPTNGPANLAIARVAKAGKDDAAALDFYARALGGTWPTGQESERAEATFERVDLLEKHGQSRQAIAELLALAARATDPAVLLRAGNGLLAAGSPSQAIDVFRQVLASAPASAPAYVSLGMAELARQNYRAARAAFDQGVRLDPTDTVAQERAALCERVLTLDPTQPGLRAPERYTRSRTLLAAVLATVPTCPEAAASGGYGALVDRARRTLASTRRPASFSEATDDNEHLAEELWSGWVPACADRQRDEAVARVVERLER
jgi:tetratricopeptide (TPR) repeat protein/CBS domain-containing protein